RFMQTDPIGYGDGMNWYAYVKNDPVNSGDPDGKQTLPSFMTNRYAENQKDCNFDLTCTQKKNMEQDDEQAKTVATATSFVVGPEMFVGGFLAKVGIANSGRVFWSGGPPAREAAETFAKANGKHTLEMTFQGKALQSL